MYRTDFWTLGEKARVGWSERTTSTHVYYQVWNRSPVQVGCMRQVLGAGALGWPRGMGWGGRLEGGSGWGTHVNPWLIHVNVWQKPLQYCKVISLQLIMEKKKLNLGHSYNNEGRLPSSLIYDSFPTKITENLLCWCQPIDWWWWSQLGMLGVLARAVILLAKPTDIFPIWGQHCV